MPDTTYYCTWCGAEAEVVYEPDYPGERMVGVCSADDGIVYVTTDASAAE